MSKKFDIKARNEKARKDLQIVENEQIYGRKRSRALAESMCAARDRGDAETAARVRQEWSKNNEELRRLEDRRRELLITLAEKKYANEHMYSDIQPWEVIEERSETTIVVRRMKSTLKESAKKELHESFVPGGFLGHFDNDTQEWDIEPDEGGIVLTLRKHKDGRWCQAGCSTPFILAGAPERFYDYNF